MCNICGFFAFNSSELLLHKKETHLLHSIPIEGRTEKCIVKEEMIEENIIVEDLMPIKKEIKMEIDESFLPEEQSMYF